MHTVQNYIYAQQQMHFCDIDYYEGVGKTSLRLEEIGELFPDLNSPDEVHPMLGYYGC